MSKWEYVEFEPNGPGGRITTHRIPVPGGWMYRVAGESQERVEGMGRHGETVQTGRYFALCFVPDPTLSAQKESS